MKIKEFAQPVKREETIQPEESYELLGIRLNGNGLYVRERKKGSEIATNTLNKVQEGDFIYSRLFGWRGAFGIVPEKFDGLYVSNEFPTFEIDESKVNKEFLLRYFLLPKTLHEVESYCIGTTKQSRNRFKEPYFLDMEVEFPRIEEQDRLNDRLANTEKHVSQIKSKGEENEGLIKQLRQSILQEAIQGKLTEEWRKTNPDAEPADQLVARIQKEKERLIREKQIKKEKPLPPVSEEEKPFELPEGWVWCRLLDLSEKVTDGVHSRPDYASEGVPFLSVKDISKGVIDFSDARHISNEDHKKLINRCNPEYGDILITKVGTTGIGKVVDVDKPFSIFVSVALVKLFKNFLHSKYFENVINSPLIRAKSKEGTEGVGNQNLVLKKIKNFPIPLPPVEEQKAIAWKVNQLMTYCDDLEAQVKQSQTHAEQLMEAVLGEVFEREGAKNEKVLFGD